MKEARSGEGFAPNNGNALLGLNAGSIFPTCAEVKFPQVAGFDDQPAPQRRSVAGKARGILEWTVLSEQSLKTASTLLCGDVGAFSITLGENIPNFQY
jgi:hypothetical protein